MRPPPLGADISSGNAATLAANSKGMRSSRAIRSRPGARGGDVITETSWWDHGKTRSAAGFPDMTRDRIAGDRDGCRPPYQQPRLRERLSVLQVIDLQIRLPDLYFRRYAMANNDNIPKVDRRGSTVLVPLGFAAVFVLLAGLMLMRTERTAPTPPPPATSQSTSPTK